MPSTFSVYAARRRAEHDMLGKQKHELVARHSQLVADLSELHEARDVTNAVMLVTQESLKCALEDIVTLALKAVFGEQYSFEITYGICRGKSEAVLAVKKNGELYNAEDECGGGIIDVVSFGLRVALWSISKQRSAPVFILDEPGRFLSATKAPLFGAVLKEISNILGVQIIAISHSEALIDTADKAFVVSQANNVSKIEVV